MVKNLRSVNYLTIIFVISELILCVSIQLTSGAINQAVSFGAIVLSFFFSLLMLEKDRDMMYTTSALLGCVFADLLLVAVAPPQRTPAMLFFTLTQAFYFLRIQKGIESDKIKKIHVLARGVSMLVGIFAELLLLKEKIDVLSVISIIYYVNLICNIVFSFFMREKSYFLSVGLILFALCDLSVGLSILDQLYIELTEGMLLYYIANPGFNLAWVFYVPSQTLLSMSVLKDKRKIIKATKN